MSRKTFIGFKALASGRDGRGAVRLSGYLSGEVFAACKRQRTVKVTILRTTETPFTFNHDYAEYFDGIAPTDGEVLFEGELPLGNGRKVEFCDETASIGQTYCYWMALPGEAACPPAGPAYVRVRDERVWWPFGEIERRLAALVGQYPHLAQLSTFGESTAHRPMAAVRLGNRDRCIALVGAVHAGESGPELLVPIVERLARDEPELLGKIGVALLPSVNPDERERQVRGVPWYLRTNPNGVDLNRNFPAGWEKVDLNYGLDSSDPDSMTYRGERPASESETRAVMSFMEEVRPEAVFATHSLAGICSPVFLTSGEAIEDASFTARCHEWITPYTGGYYEDQRPAKLKFACSAGSLPHWLYKKWGVPAFDLEWDRDEKTRPCTTDETTPTMIAACAEQHYRGILTMLQAQA